MKLEQLSVFLENKFGRLSLVTRALGEAGINIRALCIADNSDFGILRIIVNDNDKAVTALKAAGFTVIRTEVIAVEVPDKPGGLADLLEILDKEKINVEYMYCFVEPKNNCAVDVIKVDDGEQERAKTVMKQNNITLLEGDALYQL